MSALSCISIETQHPCSATVLYNYLHSVSVHIKMVVDGHLNEYPYAKYNPQLWITISIHGN